MTRMFTSFASRTEAGRKLGQALAALNFRGSIVVLGLPRGGVPVAAEVAHALGAPLDVMVVRKIGAPYNPELACGAVASGDIVVWNGAVLRRLQLREQDLEPTVRSEKLEVRRREHEIRGASLPPAMLRGKTVILVDDGLATGASMRAAIEAVHTQLPAQIVVAVPVAPMSTCEELSELGARVECMQRIRAGRFSSVGEWYDDFTQVSTDECRRLLLQHLDNQPSVPQLRAM